jgi:hypothetical protein
MITQSTIFSIIIFDYQVVIIKHNYKSQMNIIELDEWLPFTMTIKESSRVHRTLVSSSTRKPWWVVCGWPKHYPNVIREV